MWRACVGRDLVLLAASADQQLEYCQRTGCPWEELSNQWLSWDDEMLPQLIHAGALTPEIEQTANEITESLRKYGQEVGDEIRRVGYMGPYQKQFSERAIREDQRWEHIRVLATKALAGLHKLGVITRKLTDPDYNTAVIEPDP
jgi:hypothetical protein